RREDDRLLTGQGRYTADWNLSGQLYGCFLRSDRAHARILSLKKEIPGKEIVAIFTGEDTAGFKTPRAQVKLPGRGGVAIKVPHRPILATDRVRYVGQEVAFVVATSAAAAQDAVERIEIEYEDLPPVVNEVEALQEGAPQLHDEIPGNL